MLKEEASSATDYLTDVTDVTDVRKKALVIYRTAEVAIDRTGKGSLTTP